MVMQWVRMAMERLNPNLSVDKEPKLDYSKVDLDLLSNLFGTEEAKNQLLNVIASEQVSSEQVLKDSLAMELMLKTYPWKIYEKAIWRRTIGALRDSLESSTIEKREAYRNKVMAHLSDLHLPYELRWEADRIKKMKELTKAAQQQI